MDLNHFMIELQPGARKVEVMQKGEGPDLVFLHGAGGMGAWSPELEVLAATHRVTVPLFPGFGRTEGVEHIAELQDAVFHTFDVLEALGIVRPHLIGHSMGGMIAAEMAAMRPAEIGHLVLMAPLGLWDDAHPVLDFFTVMPQDLARYVFHDQTHPMAVRMATPPAPDDDALIDDYVGYIRGLSAAGRLLWPIPERGLAKRLHRIKSPTLVLWGETDRLIPPSYAAMFVRGIPGAKGEIIADASHMLPYEQPAKVAASLKSFLPSATRPQKPAKAKAAPKKIPPKKAAPKKKASQKPVAKAPTKPAPKKAAPKKTAPKQAAAKPAPNPTPKNPAKKAAPPKAAPKKPAPAKKSAAKPTPKKKAPPKPLPKKKTAAKRK